MIKSKRGDTLVEVTIAIGIFSMIAIAIASVMSSGTSGSQMALETTLAREEIDAQAEALRFIHASYISSRNYRSKDPTNINEDIYLELWRKITDTENANTNELQPGNTIPEEITKYAPSSCDELYNDLDDGSNKNLIQKQKAFVLDVKHLNNLNAYISSNDPNFSKVFVPTTTYPHLIFTDSDADEQNTTLIDSSNNLFQAAGIYVIAVKDPNTTSISDSKTSAFYDFYIRTCWYGTDATRPSTISTVIRLYDPDVSSKSN